MSLSLSASDMPWNLAILLFLLTINGNNLNLLSASAVTGTERTSLEQHRSSTRPAEAPPLIVLLTFAASPIGGHSEFNNDPKYSSDGGGIYWTLVFLMSQRENPSNAFVYAAFRKEPFSFSIILTRSATDCACIFCIARPR